ncbi:hypothetical protein GII36_01940 [Candidatus Mycosynbacter amalyticus]|uniref:Uncharacterized protein n=1 Tax=Candidatus Mycosynbacter amalyticus TaxID=2665156 RepID=A0A857MPL4_9BACT|nr:hypothetical protein [Candidatus Mycosynbacter amalyticus]QHN42610.1 hypothetical protein GII36_01940 [Candidatus Mycosynbacter amalyticus]
MICLFILRSLHVSLAEGSSMDNKLSPWLEDSGVAGYGYRGRDSLRVSHDTHDFPVQERKYERKQGNSIVRRLYAALSVLLRLPLVACKGDSALEEYYARRTWLLPVVLAIAVVGSVAFVMCVILWP